MKAILLGCVLILGSGAVTAETPAPTPAPLAETERLFPREWPLSHYEMSFLLPHLLRDKELRVEAYFTRVYNPVWTNPDGCSWIEMLEDEQRIGCHVALTPIWSETAQWADYVLPTGLGAERHDLMSQETHAGTWIGFRQPVLREFRERKGETIALTKDANPGEVWEEAEFWVALTWKIDPDGSLGIRIGAINPNVFQDQHYKYGSLGNPDAPVRQGRGRTTALDGHHRNPVPGIRRWHGLPQQNTG